MKLISVKSTLATTVAMLVTLAMGQAMAQQAPAAVPAAAVPPPVEVTASGDAIWLKVCGNDPTVKKDVCRTGFDLRTEGSQSLIASMLIMDGVGPKGNGYRVLMQVPNSLMIQPGLKVRVDDDKEQDVKFAICYPENCLAAFDIADTQLARLKTAKTFRITATRETLQGVSFIIPMTSFKAAIEGAATSAEEVKKRDDAIQQKAEDTAKSMEDRLLEAQRKAQQQE